MSVEVQAFPKRCFAVITLEGEPFVFVEKTETEYKRRTVVTEPTSGDLVKIHEWLKAGEREVVRATAVLKGAGSSACRIGPCHFRLVAEEIR